MQWRKPGLRRCTRGIGEPASVRVCKQRRERGFAVVATLWVCIALALITASVLHLGRSDVRMARMQEIARQRSLESDAMLTLVIGRLQGQPGVQPPVDGTPFTVTLGDAVSVVTITDEAGKIDLNDGREDLLRLALLGVGFDLDAADAISNRIRGWRSTASERTMLDEAEIYRLAGLDYGPRGGRFRSVGELRLLPGMPDAGFRQLAPLVTVYSQTPTIDPTFADRRLLLALRATESAAALELRRRDDERLGLVSRGQRPVVVQGHAYTVNIRQSNFGIERTAVIRLTGRSDDPVWVYRWR